MTPVVRTITAIRLIPNDPDRCAIHSDRTVIARIRMRDADRLGLCKGMPLTEELDTELKELAHIEKARRDVLRRCASRLRSQREAVQMFLRKGVDEATAEALTKEFARLGIVDDAAAAEAVIHGVLRQGPAGKRLLEQKLRQRGVDRDAASHALSVAMEDRDIEADAQALASKRAAKMPHTLDSAAQVRRIAGFLMRRGFDSQIAWEAARRSIARGETSDDRSQGMD